MAGTAMVWGASGGIGRALVRLLTAQEWETVAIARHEDDMLDLTPYVIDADVSKLTQRRRKRWRLAFWWRNLPDLEEHWI